MKQMNFIYTYIAYIVSHKIIFFLELIIIKSEEKFIVT